MPRPKRDTYVYQLKDGHRIVYYGLSKSPKESFIRHQNSDKKFTHLCVIRGPMFRYNAELLEYAYIIGYQKQHGGRPPKYNVYKRY